jgi:hypothetical protein
VITVGESSWQRHLVVEDVTSDGGNAVLNLLSHDQSFRPVIDLQLKHVELRLTLAGLVSGGFLGVKSILMPRAEASGPDHVFVSGPRGENEPLSTH